jgi:RND family efflux transporter MFP subunit
MKTRYTFLIGFFLLVSCGETTRVSENLQELTIKKQQLKQQLAGVSKALMQVELAISKLDTLKKLPIVTVLKSTITDFSHYINVQGTIQADKSVVLRTEMGGTVTKIFVKEGQEVTKGTVLAQLDASILANKISEVTIQYNLSKTTFDRQERLWEQQIGSEMQYLQAKSVKERLESAIKTLQVQEEKLKIIAPFSGIVDAVFAKEGELTSPQIPFLRLVNLNQVYIECDVTESYAKSIKKGTRVLVAFPSLEYEVGSTISQVGSFINPSNRSFKIRVELKNTNKAIKTNLLARLKINDFSARGIVIPTYIIQKDTRNNTFVYTLTQDKEHYKVVKTLVKVTKEYNNQSYISAGLIVDMMLVDKGAKLVKSEDEVVVSQ